MSRWRDRDGELKSRWFLAGWAAAWWVYLALLLLAVALVDKL